MRGRSEMSQAGAFRCPPALKCRLYKIPRRFGHCAHGCSARLQSGVRHIGLQARLKSGPTRASIVVRGAGTSVPADKLIRMR